MCRKSKEAGRRRTFAVHVIWAWAWARLPRHQLFFLGKVNKKCWRLGGKRAAQPPDRGGKLNGTPLQGYGLLIIDRIARNTCGRLTPE